MRRFYALLIPIITLLNIYILESQEIVFNEYRSAYLENPASIELLVVENYLDMRGFYLRDSYNDKWAVGVKFRYNDLWKNIKSGTCIVVDLDGNSYPTYDEMQNGVIRVNINDAEYFEFLDTNLKADINAKGKFEIESKSDLFQILNSGKNHIHTASHGSEISYLYNNTPQPKLRLNSNLPIHCSFNVYPGKNIDGYYSTFTANVVQSEHVSIGRANIVNGATSYNADFGIISENLLTIVIIAKSSKKMVISFLLGIRY